MGVLAVGWQKSGYRVGTLRMMLKWLGTILLVGMAIGGVAAQSLKPGLIPSPKSFVLSGGDLRLGPGSRIVAADKRLAPLAKMLSDEVFLMLGRRLTVVTGLSRPGDIALKINPALRAGRPIRTVRGLAFTTTLDGAHRITVTDRARVEGFDYKAVCEGTATVLQILRPSASGLSLPRMTIGDWPEADYTAVMVDVGRQEIPIETLKQCVDACRFYKARYMQLHLSDDHGWTFPSKAFPKLGSRNSGAHGGLAPKVYDLQELKELVAYADARGVTLVPEFETPGHSGAMRLAMPDVFDLPEKPGGEARLAVLNIANDAIYGPLDTLVREMCDVFKSSPYFHIGCDETIWHVLEAQPQTQAYMNAHGMTGIHDLFKQHVGRMLEIVRRHGKVPVAWEGVALDDSMKDKLAVMTWVGSARTAEALQKQGFTTITVPWDLGVPFPEWNMYQCNGSKLTREDRVLGAMVPLWEMSASALISTYIPRIPERQERTWGPDNAFEEKEFLARKDALEARLARLIKPIRFRPSSLLDPESPDTNAVHTTMAQTLDSGKLPTLFAGKMSLVLESGVSGATIRYTLDGSTPNAASPVYRSPMELTESTTVIAAPFDAKGARIGHACAASYTWVDYEKNLTTGKPITSSGVQEQFKPEYVVDGMVLRDKAWWAPPAPQWVKIDLQGVYNLNRVDVFPYWDGFRSYQYTVELSVDGQKWTQIVDMRRATAIETQKGHRHEFAATPARYMRVNMLHNTANPSVHLVEVRAYEAKM